eukprot:601028-Prymnesium_polylepis.1
MTKARRARAPTIRSKAPMRCSHSWAAAPESTSSRRKRLQRGSGHDGRHRGHLRRIAIRRAIGRWSAPVGHCGCT